MSHSGLSGVSMAAQFNSSKLWDPLVIIIGLLLSMINNPVPLLRMTLKLRELAITSYNKLIVYALLSVAGICSEKLHLRSYLETLWSETRYFGLLGNNHILFFYPIIYYRRIKVYRVKTMDMERSHWNNSVIWTFIISISTTVLIVRDKILW